MNHTVVSKDKVRAALARAESLGAQSLEQACDAAAQALGIPVEMVREVAYETSPQKSTSDTQ